MPHFDDDIEERDRLMRRAAQIWGDNPFSPEAMEQDAALKDIEAKTGRAQKRLRRLEDTHRAEGDL